MIKRDKELIVVGDRVLVRVEEGEERTNVGLYLPPTAIDNQAVQGGTIVATGPGPADAESGFVRPTSRGARRRARRHEVRSDAGAERRLRAVFPQGGGRDHVRGRSLSRRAAGGDSCARARRVARSHCRPSTSRLHADLCDFPNRCTTSASSPRCARTSRGSA